MPATPAASSSGAERTHTNIKVSPATSTPICGRVGPDKTSLFRLMSAHSEQMPSPIVNRSNAESAGEARNLLADLMNSSQNLSASGDVKQSVSWEDVFKNSAEQSKMSVQVETKSGESAVDDSLVPQRGLSGSSGHSSARENAPPLPSAKRISHTGRSDRSRSILIRDSDSVPADKEYETDDSDLSERAQKIRRARNQDKKLKLARDRDARARAIQPPTYGAGASKRLTGGRSPETPAKNQLESTISHLDRSQEQFSFQKVRQSKSPISEDEGSHDESGMVKKKSGAAKNRIISDDESSLDEKGDKKENDTSLDSELDETSDNQETDVDSDGQHTDVDSEAGAPPADNQDAVKVQMQKIDDVNNIEETDSSGDFIPQRQTKKSPQKNVSIIELDDSSPENPVAPVPKMPPPLSAAPSVAAPTGRPPQAAQNFGTHPTSSAFPQTAQNVKAQIQSGRWSPRSMAAAPASVSSKFASGGNGNDETCGQKVDLLSEKRVIEMQLDRMLRTDGSKAPDGGHKHRTKVAELNQALTRVNSQLAALQARNCASGISGTSAVSQAVTGYSGASQATSGQLNVDMRDAMERALTVGNTGGRLYAGQMTYERHIQARGVINTAAERLHRVCTGMPPEDAELTDPDHLTVPLLRHQKQGLKWMCWRETQPVAPGGILADDMGLGKTLSLISLILKQKQLRKQGESEEAVLLRKKRDKIAAEQGLIVTNATLVICPTSLMGQWETEMEQRVKKGRVSYMRYHGSRTKDPKMVWDCIQVHNKISSSKNFASPTVLEVAFSANVHENTIHHSFRNYDVVVSTYGTVGSECGNDPAAQNSPNSSGDRPTRQRGGTSPLLRVAWERLVLDEAHNIKTHTTKAAKGCCKIAAATRWCLTGTPIHNKLTEFYSLLRFLRHSPFDELAVWKEHIESRQKTEQGRECLATLVKSILLRRTKEQTDKMTGKPLVHLPARKYEELSVTMAEREQAVYDKLFEASRLQVAEIVNHSTSGGDDEGGLASAQNRNIFRPTGGNAENQGAFFDMSHILVLLLRLRQAAVHYGLLKEAVDVEALSKEADGRVETAANEKNVLSQMAHMSLDESQIAMDVDGLVEGVTCSAVDMFESSYASAKVRSVLHTVRKVVAIGEKCVVVSQWTKFLDIIQEHLKKASVKIMRIDGQVHVRDRQPIVNAFNRDDNRGCALLLSLTAGGVGLNLIGGNHLILVDLHWNPALESQAADRIYRMGQTRNTFVHKLVCEGTVEKRILQVQEQKKQLAKSVLEGARVRQVNKLTLADLKFLFELDGPKAKNVKS